MPQDCLWPGGPVYYYGDGVFRPSTDSFLLGGFAPVRRFDRVCDLGAGMGLLGLLLWAREPSVSVTAVELSPMGCELCRRMADQNGMDMTVVETDFRDRAALPMGRHDLVVCNPPYFSLPSGATAEARPGEARSEVTATLEDVLSAAAWLLPTGGRLAMVYRPERLTDLLCAARGHGLEPKRLRLVHHDARSAPSMVLLECRRGGRPGLAVEPPLLLLDGVGQETEDVKNAYFRHREEP
ncbi:MAG: methyltransferase [Oscillospiraceae bacterium]|nr:methyltransferase [Oscillospiraceae bacterium]